MVTIGIWRYCEVSPMMCFRLPILMAFAAKYIGSNYGEFAADYKVLVEANLRCGRTSALTR